MDPDVTLSRPNREKFLGNNASVEGSHEFIKNTQALCVINGVCRDVKGNCWESFSQDLNLTTLSTSLPKHRCCQKTMH